MPDNSNIFYWHLKSLRITSNFIENCQCYQRSFLADVSHFEHQVILIGLSGIYPPGANTNHPFVIQY
jgi:hypothetical protein